MPGGFGKRGTEGKIAAAEWGRKMRKPYLGMNSKLQTGFLGTVMSRINKSFPPKFFLSSFLNCE